MERALEFQPLKVALNLNGKIHNFEKFSLDRQLAISMRFSEGKGLENGIKRFAKILSEIENFDVYFETVTEVVYMLLSPDSKKGYPTLCSFRDVIREEPTTKDSADMYSRTSALAQALNASIENSQPVMDAARLKVDNDNLKKKLHLKNQQTENLQKILGLKRTLNSVRPVL